MQGGGVLGQQHLRDGMHQHQNGGQQRGQHPQGDAGPAVAGGWRGDGELVQQALVGLGAHARRDEGAVERAPQHHGRDGCQKAVQHGGADRGLEGGNRRQRTGMGRHHAVHGGQGRDHRNTHIDIGRALEAGLALQLLRHAEDQRQHHDQADFKEHGNADDEGHQRHGPGDHAGRGVFQYGCGNLLGDAYVGQDLAQHGPQRNHHAHGAQRLACAIAELLDDLGGRHAGGEAHADGDHQQGQQGVHLDARDDERDQQQHADQGGQQQLGIERGHG